MDFIMVDNLKDIRWKQRFEAYQKAVDLIKRIISKENLDEASQLGLIQAYQITFELAWKLLKDKLEADGFIVKSPRESIKIAFQNNYIVDGTIWLEGLESRNELSHIYSENKALENVDKIITKYLPCFEKLLNTLSLEI